MAKSAFIQANKQIENKVVHGYKKIEEGVVGGYHHIEDAKGRLLDQSRREEYMYKGIMEAMK